MAPQAKTTLHNQENLLPKPQLFVVVALLGIVLAIVNMDGNGISTILPKIAADLDAQNTISWVGTSSLIATTVFSVLYGRLSDIFGRTAMFVGACLLFAAADLVCGFAANPPMLYVFRAVAGLSGGGVGSLAMIVASDIVTLEERGRYQGICGSFMALGNVAGPFIAAGFASGLTWRGFFWFLSPLGVVCAVLAGYLLPPTSPPDAFMVNFAKIDFLGSLTSSVAIVFILIPVSGGGSYYQWDSPMVISMLAIGGIAAGAFILIEWKWASLPIISMSIFQTRDVCALLMQTFTLGWVYQTCLYFLPLYYQNLRGWSPIVSASLLTPIVGLQIFSSVVSGRYISQKKRYGGVIRLGLVSCFVGCGLMIMFDHSTHPGVCVVILLLMGIGVGNSNQPTVVAIQAHTPKDLRAVVISCRNFFRFLGAACGVAVSAAILQESLKSALPKGYKNLATSAYSLPKLNQTSQSNIVSAYEIAIRNVFITNASVMALCLLCCIWWRDNGLERSESDEGATEADQAPVVNVNHTSESQKEEEKGVETVH